MTRRFLKVWVFVSFLLVDPDGARAGNWILSVKPDGTGLRVEVEPDIEGEFVTYTAPSASPDGKRLIFDATPVTDRDFENCKLLVINVDGDSKGEIESFDYGRSARWSPDGKKIAYAIYGGNPKGDRPGVWVMNTDGSQPKWIGFGRWPQWTPDGKSVITKNYGRAGVYLLKIDLDTNEEKPFLEGYDHIWQIHWSPDAKRVLAFFEDNGTRRLVTIDPDGKKNSIIELATGNITNLGYSPDGTMVCYSNSNDVGGNDLFVASPDGKTVKNLDVAPAFSKQGVCWLKGENRIVFCSSVNLL